MTAVPTRRTIVKASAWTLPVVATAAAAPAASASPTTLTNLAIEVVDPPADPNTWEPQMTVPIYLNGNRSFVVGRASLPPSLTITNVGKVDAAMPTGTITVTVGSYGDPSTPQSPANQFSLLPNGPWTLTKVPTSSAGAGSKYTFVYGGVLAPGGSATLSLDYSLTPGHGIGYQYTVLVAGVVVDQTDGDYDDNSERLGQGAALSV